MLSDKEMGKMGTPQREGGKKIIKIVGEGLKEIAEYSDLVR